MVNKTGAGLSKICPRDLSRSLYLFTHSTTP
nr:MAG TPA: hypothetical protein [Caudoviricetes sp.]